MIRILLALAFITACQDYNSNSSDRTKYGPIVSNETDPNFTRAFTVIKNRCVSCHTNTIHDHWATFTDNQKWLDEGIILKQDSDGSYFMKRIINYGGTVNDMPYGGSALPAEEYTALKTWIDNMP